MSEWAGDREGGIVAEADHGKRVGWVELYFDLVFVFVVSQVVHAVVAEPAWSRVAAALGVFTTLWWTWIGFAVLYNRQSADGTVPRLLFLLAAQDLAEESEVLLCHRALQKRRAVVEQMPAQINFPVG